MRPSFFTFQRSYRIEEAATRHAVAVVWDDARFASVRCARFANKTEANLVATSHSVDFPAEYGVLKNGDIITITELLSGFTGRRILHKFVVAEIVLKDGAVVRILVQVTPDILNDGILSLSSGHAQTPDNNGLRTEPRVARVSILTSLPRPGEPGRYPSQ